MSIPYLLKAARQSNRSLLPTKIVYVDYRTIGTHESHDFDLASDLVNGIIKSGYNGPPILVFQRGDDTLFNSVENDAVLDLEYGTLGVADGHHRFAAFGRLDKQGLLNDRHIPVQLIPAHDPVIVRTATLDDSEQPLSIAIIEACFQNPTKTIPICDTHFQAILEDGSWQRLKQNQPDMIIKKSDLLI